MAKRKQDEMQAMIYNTLHRKGIEHHELKSGGEQFLVHLQHQSCYSWNKSSDKSWMRTGPDCDCHHEKQMYRLIILQYKK